VIEIWDLKKLVTRNDEYILIITVYLQQMQ